MPAPWAEGRPVPDEGRAGAERAAGYGSATAARSSATSGANAASASSATRYSSSPSGGPGQGVLPSRSTVRPSRPPSRSMSF